MPQSKDASARGCWLWVGLVVGCGGCTPLRGGHSAPVPTPPPPASVTRATQALSTPPLAPAHLAGQLHLPPTADRRADVRRLYLNAHQTNQRTPSFVARLRRREVVHGEAKPLEVMVFKFRRQPLSVHLKWMTPDGPGREVLYVAGQHEGKVQVRLGAGDVPLMRAGTVMAFHPENPLITRSSRHPISDAGFDDALRQFGELLAALDRGQTNVGDLRYLGRVQRPEFAGPVEGLEQTMVAGADPLFPKGGRRIAFFDPLTHLPTLVIAYDHTGAEAEYYCFDRFELPLNLDDHDFDPRVLWPR